MSDAIEDTFLKWALSLSFPSASIAPNAVFDFVQQCPSDLSGGLKLTTQIAAFSTAGRGCNLTPASMTVKAIMGRRISSPCMEQPELQVFLTLSMVGRLVFGVNCATLP